MKIYVASSWRNTHQPAVVSALRAAGHEVYDFRHPGPDQAGFSWSEVDPDWRQWTPAQYLQGLKHPAAQRGFGRDFDAMRAADAFVLVMPCGRSAHLEMGWAIGQGLETVILLGAEQEAELMYLLANQICTSIDELVSWAQYDAFACDF